MMDLLGQAGGDLNKEVSSSRGMLGTQTAQCINLRNEVEHDYPIPTAKNNYRYLMKNMMVLLGQMELSTTDGDKIELGTQTTALSFAGGGNPPPGSELTTTNYYEWIYLDIFKWNISTARYGLAIEDLEHTLQLLV